MKKDEEFVAILRVIRIMVADVFRNIQEVNPSHHREISDVYTEVFKLLDAKIKG
jgi:hypothetical protein